MNDVARADDGSVLDTLEVLGQRAKFTLNKGEGLTVNAAIMVVEARRRIQGGEMWGAGRTFKHWCELYLDTSRHSAAKLLTWGGWKDVKKGLPAPSADAVTKKVEEVKQSDSARMQKNRDRKKSERSLFSEGDAAQDQPAPPTGLSSPETVAPSGSSESDADTPPTSNPAIDEADLCIPADDAEPPKKTEPVRLPPDATDAFIRISQILHDERGRIAEMTKELRVACAREWIATLALVPEDLLAEDAIAAAPSSSLAQEAAPAEEPATGKPTTPPTLSLIPKPPAALCQQARVDEAFRQREQLTRDGDRDAFDTWVSKECAPEPYPGERTDITERLFSIRAFVRGEDGGPGLRSLEQERLSDTLFAEKPADASAGRQDAA